MSAPDWRLFFSSLGLIFLSEMGDKTQITTMLLAGAKPLYVLWVALGSAAALICTSFIEVIIGYHIIARFIKPATIKLLSGVAFLVMGLLLVTGVMGSGEINSLS
ncbi:MAG: TMEM165/GDT1 family protein [Bacillota bacterium]